MEAAEVRAGGGGAAVVASGLTRTFDDEVEAVRGIDLEIARGEFFGFLGPNGAGKTTTVRMLCTLLPPSGGSATVAGLDVDAEDAPGAAADRRRPAGDRARPGAERPRAARAPVRALRDPRRRRASRRTDELLDLIGLQDADRRLRRPTRAA